MTFAYGVSWVLFAWVLFNLLSGYRSSWEAYPKFILTIVFVVALKKARLEAAR